MEEKFSLSGIKLPVKANVATAALMGIYKNRGELTAELVLEEAKKKKSPLHICFEWNDSKAAVKYRLEQARGIIKAVVITKEIHGKPTPVRAFINIRKDDKGSLTTNPFARGTSTFIYIDTVMNNEILARYTVEKALNELKALMNKYENLTELAPLFATIRNKMERIKAVPAKVAPKSKKKEEFEITT